MTPNRAEDRATRRTPTRPTEAVAVVAHRGFAGMYPENTLAAIRGASTPHSDDEESGRPPADAIEVDVMPAAGGEVVVFHDHHLGRLTDVPEESADRLVWETPIERLRELEVLGSGEPIPLFSEVMDAIPPEIGVNVELKHPGDDAGTIREFGRGEPKRTDHDDAVRERATEPWRDLVADVRDIVADHRNHVLLSSSYEGALAAAREIAPALPLAYLFWNSIEGGLDITRRYDCEAVHPPYDMIADTTLFNAGYTPTGPFAEHDLVDIAHEEGRAITVWTVTDRQQATQLRAAGVDGIITDYPGLLDRSGTEGLAGRSADSGETTTEPANTSERS